MRIQFNPDDDPEVIKGWLGDLIARAPVDEVMVFFAGEEYNSAHEPVERITHWIERSRPYRDMLRESGVQVSLNPWFTLGHRDNNRTLHPGQNWQTMVGVEGETAAACACPLDPGWRAYFEELMRLFAQEDFRVIWVEDDIRFHNHGPLKWGGCFCPLHVAEFNRRAGTQATREEIVGACTAPGEPHPWRKLWFEMWDETQREIITRWREIAEAGGVRLGLMSSTIEAHSAEGRDWGKWWQALAGDKPPIHRPGFWSYADTIGSDVPHSIAMAQELRSLQPAGTECGPEIECFTYGRWHKSLRQTGAQMAMAHILGATNLNISLYDFMGNDPSDDSARADFLRRWRPVCDWLADEFPMTLRSVGVGLAWSPEMGARLRLEEGSQGRWESLVCHHRDWASWLGAFGQAFAMGFSPTVNALSGRVVRSFTDEELREWLSRGLLLDGPTAEYLCERGFADLLGVRQIRRVRQGEVLYSYEESRSEEFGLRPKARMSVNLLPAITQADLAEGARTVTDVYDPWGKQVGHGLVLYENAAGGRVAWYPWSTADRWVGIGMTVQRWAEFTKAIAWLARGRSLGRVEGGPWLVPQFLTDGANWRGVVWNASPDSIEGFTVYPPEEMGRVNTVTQITAEGEFLTGAVEGGRVSLRQPMQQWEFVVLG